jgi:prepilin-type processing-associated H-X9-DG protein
MNTGKRADTRAGLTLLEVVVVVLVVAAIAGLLLPALARQREETRKIRCRNNLNQLSKGMATYITELGERVPYPCPLGRGEKPDTYNGAEWLASLYWTGVVPDPDVFLCPSSMDMNADGKDIGCKKANDCGGRFSSQTVSYAGPWWKSVNTQSGGALPAYFPDPLPAANEPMACDDTQGGINHGGANGGMNILFFDSHVEFRTTAGVDVTSEHGSVGQGFPNPPMTLLWRLRN